VQVGVDDYWQTIEDGDLVLWTVSREAGVIGDRDQIVVVGYEIISGEYNGPATNTIYYYKSIDEQGRARYENGANFISIEPPENHVLLYHNDEWRGAGVNLPNTLGPETERITTVTIDWYGPVTNATRFLSPGAVTNAANYLIQQHTAAVASADTLGHIKVGSGLAIDGGGVLSATGGATDFDIHSSWKLAPSVGNSFYNAALSLGGIALAANSLTSTAYWAVTPSTNKYTMVAIRAEFNSPGSSETRTRFVYRSPTSMSTNVTVLTTGAISSGVYRFVLPPYYGAHIPGAQIMTVTGRPSTHVTQLGFTVMYRVATDAEAATYVAP
jgi:hypothetical protein